MASYLTQYGYATAMNKKELWINQIKGLCICLVVIYHSVITFYPHLTTFQHPLSQVLTKCWIYLNLYLAPFRMPVFFFISGYLIRRYITNVPWTTCVDKRIWSIAWVLILWGIVQWLALTTLNNWLAPQRDLGHAANAAYAGSVGDFTRGMLTASTSLWYLYALIVYFVLCKIFSRWALPLLVLFAFLSVAINFFPTPWWGLNSVIRNLPYYSLGAWFGTTLMMWIKDVPLRRHSVLFLVSTIVAAVAHVQSVKRDWCQYHRHLHYPPNSGGTDKFNAASQTQSYRLVRKRRAGPATGVSVRLLTVVYAGRTNGSKNFTKNRCRPALLPAVFLHRSPLNLTRFLPPSGGESICL